MLHSKPVPVVRLAPEAALNQQRTAMHSGIIGSSPALRAARDMVRKIASSNVLVLIRGETGTGKDLFARSVHAQSGRRSFPFVTINCAAMNLPDSVNLDAGAGFLPLQTGNNLSVSESASGGATLFLDEIGDMPMQQQGRLLHLIGDLDKHGRFAGRPSAVSVRIVAATHANLEAMVQQGEFREDLYYRLTNFPIHLPALRDRVTDMIDLAWYFYREYCALHHKSLAGIAPAALNCIRHYHYPGNVRELENAVERAVLLCDPNEMIGCAHLPSGWRSTELSPSDAEQQQRSIQALSEACPTPGMVVDWQGGSLRDTVNLFEADLIQQALRSNDWNQTHTAQALGIPRRTLIDKMNRFKIAVPARRRVSDS